MEELEYSRKWPCKSRKSSKTTDSQLEMLNVNACIWIILVHEDTFLLWKCHRSPVVALNQMRNVEHPNSNMTWSCHNFCLLYSWQLQIDLNSKPVICCWRCMQTLLCLFDGSFMPTLLLVILCFPSSYLYRTKFVFFLEAMTSTTSCFFAQFKILQLSIASVILSSFISLLLLLCCVFGSVN